MAYLRVLGNVEIRAAVAAILAALLLAVVALVVALMGPSGMLSPYELKR